MTLETQLLFLKERLQEAVNVTHTAPENKDQGYPYATGYSKSVMENTVKELERIMQQLSDSQEVDF
jgi:hypothetical protein